MSYEWKFLAILAAIAAIGIMSDREKSHENYGARADIYVSPSGSETNSGTTPQSPITLDEAIKRVKPGQTIGMMPGKYTNER